MTRIPAHATATIAFARIDDLLRESHSRSLAGELTRTRQATERKHPTRKHTVSRLRPTWWTQVATARLRQIPLA
jgi:hypothetical protein